MRLGDLGSVTSDARYILGHSDVEQQRLREQAEFMEPLTRRFLLDAGLRPGMRVLDVGSGFGDVALLIAELVGPDGAVVGVDREPAAVADASRRADEVGAGNVSFLAGDLREIDPGGPFDAVIGRFVLMYLAHAADAIVSIAQHVRPGGIVAFQEWHGSDPFIADPPVPLWTQTGERLVETFHRAGTNIHAGLQLREAFEAAGLPSPELRAERLTGGGARYGGYRYLAGVIRSIEPMIEQYGVATADELDVETLEHRLRVAAESSHATVAFSAIISAWATTRVARHPG